MNQNRRVFRGRAGATDNQLPKHNARRRKPAQASTKGSNKYGDAPPPPRGRRGSHTVVSEDDEDHDEPLTVQQPSSQQPPWKVEIRHLLKRIQNVQESIQTGSEGIVSPTTYQRNVLYAVENCIQEWRSILHHYHYQDTDGASSCNSGVVEEDTTVEPPAMVEEDDTPILVSSTELPDAPVESTTTTAIHDMDSETLRETGLAVFTILQLSVQCGPLQGGSPGYFKRCGGDVAQLVLEYLNRITDDYDDNNTDGKEHTDDTPDVAVDDNNNNNNNNGVREENAEENLIKGEEQADSDNDDENDNFSSTAATTPATNNNHKCACARLQFSVRQTEAIAEWKRNARKAALLNKPPSKSALKLQQGKSKKSQKKNQKGKKK